MEGEANAGISLSSMYCNPYCNPFGPRPSPRDVFEASPTLTQSTHLAKREQVYGRPPALLEAGADGGRSLRYLGEEVPGAASFAVQSLLKAA